MMKGRRVDAVLFINFQKFKTFSGGILFGSRFAFSITFRLNLSNVQPYTKGFIMVRAAFMDNGVNRHFLLFHLDKLLELAFVVMIRRRHDNGVEYKREMAVNNSKDRIKTAVQINGCNNRFKGVCQDGLFLPSFCLDLTFAKLQIR